MNLECSICPDCKSPVITIRRGYAVCEDHLYWWYEIPDDIPGPAIEQIMQTVEQLLEADPQAGYANELSRLVEEWRQGQTKRPRRRR